MADRPTSFSKSLFFGRIPEEMVVPYPRLPEGEREKLKSILESLRNIAKERINAAEIDETSQIPEAVLSALKGLGLFGLTVPEAHGGLGLSQTAYARVMQEVAGLDASIAATLAGHQSIGARGIVLYGTEAQQARFLPRLARGEVLAAFALTEPGAGSDAASIKARAVEQPDGSFRLSGEKTWITNGGVADVFTVFAQTHVDRGGASRDRVSAFVVERGPGVRSGPEVQKLGARASSTTSVTFDDVAVPRDQLLGELGGGFKVAMGVLNDGRLGSAAGAVGLIRHALRLAIAHATSRRQFGRPISEFSLIKSKIAKMTMEAFAAESMVYLTTGLVDAGVADYSVESAVCKVYASEALWRVANEAAQIAAGLGYVKPYPYERLLRDARLNLVFEGTNEILRCYIALTGMQGPGDRLAQLADFIKWPLKGYGLAIDFVVEKLKTQYVSGDRLEKAHPLLKKEAVLFEDWVPELAKAVEKSLRKHGKEISEAQMLQARVADVTIDLYMMIACIARTTAAMQDKGAPEAEREARLCRAVCGRAAMRIKRAVRMLDDNDDELLKAIARDATDATVYPFDVVLG